MSERILKSHSSRKKVFIVVHVLTAESREKPSGEPSHGQPSEDSSTSGSETMFNLENFERELQWCVDQLQLGLERQNPDSKQAMEAVKVLKILQSSKAPLVKKRQAMRNTFGDYRAKMRKEQAKSAATAKKMKLSAVEETSYLKSKFIKKSCSKNSQTQSTHLSAANDLDIAGTKGENSGADLNESFRFNFSISDNSSGSLENSSLKGGNENLNVAEKETASNSFNDFKMEKSDNAFRFNFDMTDKT